MSDPKTEAGLTQHPGARPGEHPHALAFIDALRGVAVSLVIASHVFPEVRNLPWTVKRFTNLGFFGVQLFFVVSCFTLARSWRQRARTAPPSVLDFAMRRWFRIAPAYFLSAVFYTCLPPVHLPDGWRVVTFLSFTSGWSPGQMPTVAGVWGGVPGGWSIAAEFAFYAVFPLLIIGLRGPGRALLALAASLPIAYVANQAGWNAYAPAFGGRATDQFLYYWFPSQLPVFLCGLVLYESYARLVVDLVRRQRVSEYANFLLLAGILLFAGLAVVPVPRLPLAGWGWISSPLVAAMGFCMITLALAVRPSMLVVNRFFVALGKVSFSAYLVHFAAQMAVSAMLPHGFFEVTGIFAAAAGLVLFLLVLAVTFACSMITYRLIEAPGIDLGARMIRRHLQRQPAGLNSGTNLP